MDSNVIVICLANANATNLKFIYEYIMIGECTMTENEKNALEKIAKVFGITELLEDCSKSEQQLEGNNVEVRRISNASSNNQTNPASSSKSIKRKPKFDSQSIDTPS